LARLNGVLGKITQKGLCTPAELKDVCQAGAFILSDCEGAEADLLDPGALPVLRSCEVLVELHEFHRPDLVATLVARFKDSHSIRFIEEQRCDPADYRLLKVLPAAWRAVAIEEAKWIGNGSGRASTRLRFLLLQPR